MADTIAVMNKGKIEQMGSATELYERPRTEFVANFLGTSNLLDGKVVRREGDLAEFETTDGARLHVPAERISGVNGNPVRAGVRPEKLHLAPAEAAASDGNVLRGHITDASYLGVMTQYIVRAGGADLTVIAQNRGAAGLETLGPGREVVVSWEPNHTFVVSKEEDSSAQ
jgi:spermidine/putrescine transport system ATP-binding protein